MAYDWETGVSGVASGASAGSMLGPIGTGVGAVAGGLLGFLKKKKAKNPYADIQIPTFTADENFTKNNNYLSSLGIDILGGKIPEYYKGIGEQGGAEFNDYLNMTNADLTRGVMDSSAAAGRGSSRVYDQVKDVVGRNTVTSRYNDFLRAMGGKEFLLTAGKGMTEGARNAGLDNQGQTNSFALNKTKLEMAKAGSAADFDATAGALSGEGTSGLMNLILNAGQDVGGLLKKKTGSIQYPSSNIGGINSGEIDLMSLLSKIRK